MDNSHLGSIPKEDKATPGMYATKVENPPKTNSVDPKPDKLYLAKVNLMIAFFFILCHSVRWIHNVYEIINGTTGLKPQSSVLPLWILTALDISIFLIIVASSMNCYIYYRFPICLLSKIPRCREKLSSKYQCKSGLK